MLKSSCTTIMYHLSKKQYYFLEDISASLLQLMLCNPEKIPTFLKQNKISDTEFSEFYEEIASLGIFDDTVTLEQTDIVCDGNDGEEYDSINALCEELSQNDLFYAFHLDVTNRCNMRCVHCYHCFENYDFLNELGLDEIKNIIDTIYNLGVFNITLSGGEIFLRKDLYSILEYISQKQMLITLYTNATLLDNESIQKLKNYNILKISVSLYSDSPEIHDSITKCQGSFARTLESIQLLRDNDFSVELKCVAMNENKDTLMSTKSFAETLGCSFLLDFGLCGKIDGDCSTYEHRISNAALKRLFFQFPEICCGREKDYSNVNEASSPCNAGRYSLYCDAAGEIYPCVGFRYKLCQSSQLANLKNNKKLQIWRNIKISDFSDCMKHDYCKYCMEICAGNNLNENGDFLKSNTTHCERAKIICEYFRSEGR